MILSYWLNNCCVYDGSPNNSNSNSSSSSSFSLFTKSIGCSSSNEKHHTLGFVVVSGQMEKVIVVIVQNKQNLPLLSPP
jgi:hypothetical protein